MNYNNHPLNNKFILSKGGEHGKQVIKFWQDQGVNTSDFTAQNRDWYYGIYNGKFTVLLNLPPELKIIELPLEYLQKQENKSDHEIYAVYNNDKVNSILSIALRSLSAEELNVLSDALFERTCNAEEIDFKSSMDKLNPYPIDVFTEPTEEEWKGIGEFLTSHGKNPDRIFAKWGRMVWENCVSSMSEIFNFKYKK